MTPDGLKFIITATISDYLRDRKLTEPDDVTIIRDINYAGTTARENNLDVYYPKGTTEKLPVIVSIHGGGYVYGSKEIYKYYGMYLAQQGFVFINFNYHLAPLQKFPGHLTETNMVMEWLVKHADRYFADLNNVFMVGDSAGAQMTSQYAAICTNPEYASLFPFSVPEGFTLRAVALNCGLYDLTTNLDSLTRDLKSDYFGKEVPEDQLPMLDVLGNITADYPPSFIMTSYYDFLKANARPMFELLKSRGVRCKVRCYGKKGQKYMGHVCHVNMNLQEAREINQEECAFFRKHAAKA